MKLKALQRLHRLRTSLQTHAKHALRMHQTDLAEVDKAQKSKSAPLQGGGQLTPGTLLHELEQLSEVLSEQARTLRARVQEAQHAHDARARDAKQMEKLVNQGRDERDRRRAQQEREGLEDWMRSRRREDP